MESDNNIVMGAYNLDVQGDVDITSRGSGVSITAEAGNSLVNLTAMGGINLTVDSAVVAVESVGVGQTAIKLLGGLTGKITQTAGPPLIGPTIVIDLDSITLSVGPPGIGASIVLNTEGITLKHGLTSFKLSGLTGIEESVLPNSRKLNPIGHELLAAETHLKVGVAGIDSSAPIQKEEVLAVSQLKATLINVQADGIQQSQAGIQMQG